MAATRTLIVHGYGASPDAHWFPWLATTLRASGDDVSTVRLPTPDAPDRRRWEAAVAAELGDPDEGVRIVAHSLGAITSLRVLASLGGSWRLGGLVLVAGFTGPLAALPVLDAYLADDVDVERVAPRVTSRVVVRSDDDRYVPPPASDDLAGRLGADLRIVPRAGHFLADEGVLTLPLVAELLGAPAATT